MYKQHVNISHILSLHKHKTTVKKRKKATTNKFTFTQLQGY